MQLVLTVLYFCWLIAVLTFLWLIYRQTSTYIHKMEATMLNSNTASAEAALKSAEAAAKLAEMMEQEHHA